MNEDPEEPRNVKYFWWTLHAMAIVLVLAILNLFYQCGRQNP